MNIIEMMPARPYRPRRAPARFLVDAPAYVLDCFDHPEYADRYEALLIGPLNEAQDTHGNVIRIGGISHNEYCGGSFEMKAHEATLYRAANRRRRIRWLDIPEKVRGIITRFAESSG